MRSGILRCYIQTLKLRADAPFPSQMRWRRLRWLRLRLAALDGCSRDYRAAGAVDPECYSLGEHSANASRSRALSACAAASCSFTLINSCMAD